VVISGAVYKALFSTPMLLALIFAAPLLTVLSAIFGLMVSSRVNDPRAAQSFGGLLILPLILTVPFRVAGLLTVDLGTVMVFILALISLDAVLLYFATRIFQRETILTRWR
jgi:ABC-2 type transport system permease protein